MASRYHSPWFVPIVAILILTIALSLNAEYIVPTHPVEIDGYVWLEMNYWERALIATGSMLTILFLAQTMYHDADFEALDALARYVEPERSVDLVIEEITEAYYISQLWHASVPQMFLLRRQILPPKGEN